MLQETAQNCSTFSSFEQFHATLCCRKLLERRCQHRRRRWRRRQRWRRRWHRRRRQCQCLDAEADVSSALSNDAEFGFGDRHSCFVEGDGVDDLPEDTDTEDEEEEEAAAAAQAGADGGGGGGGDDDGGDGDGGGAPEHSQKTRTSYVEQLTKQRRASNQSVMV